MIYSRKNIKIRKKTMLFLNNNNYTNNNKLNNVCNNF